MSEFFELDSRYSTTRRVRKVAPEVVEAELKAARKPEDQFETTLFLPEGEGRKGEGGLRTRGFFKKSSEEKPLITVITVVFNGEAHLEETILSVITQTYDNVEYIIIDGGSTDGTFDIIRKYDATIDYWVSEKDKGISDAFNKAVQLSNGLYINFQGDGDGFVRITSLTELNMSELSKDKPIFITARIKRVSEDGSEIYTSKIIKKFNKKTLMFRMSLPHQGLLTHNTYFKQFGLFDLECVFSMDYEIILRSFSKFPLVKTSNIILSKWRNDGFGDDRIKDILSEYRKIKIKNKVGNVPLINAIYYWSMLKYSIKNILRKSIS